MTTKTAPKKSGEKIIKGLAEAKKVAAKKSAPKVAAKLKRQLPRTAKRGSSK